MVKVLKNNVCDVKEDGITMKKLLLILCMICLSAGVVYSFSGYDPAEGHLAVHFIDVGQGDAVLVQTKTHHVLVDGGDRGEIVPNYLLSRGIDAVDIVIGTHPHADHIGGLINVLRSIEVGEVIDPAVVHTTRTFEEYLTLIDEKDIPFTEGRAGMSRMIGPGVRMDILHPVNPSSDHLNDASIVARISYGSVSFMLTGDAELSSELEMINSGQTLRSTILKAGHHGSRTSSSHAFLDAVDPEVVVIMTGEGNRYGHPHEQTLAQFSRRDIEIYRTDWHGNIIISTDGTSYHIDVFEPYGDDSSYGININTASLYRLQEIIHISETRAQQLIDLRPFSSLDELTRVSGIGAARVRDIREQGLAFVE